MLQRKVKEEFSERELLVCIGTMVHSCLGMGKFDTHMLKDCPNSEQQVARFVDLHNRKLWFPLMEEQPSEEVEQYES